MELTAQQILAMSDIKVEVPLTSGHTLIFADDPENSERKLKADHMTVILIRSTEGSLGILGHARTEVMKKAVR